MPFKVLNSRTVIIAGERVLSEENSNYLSLNYFYLLLLNKAWKDIPKNKVRYLMGVGRPVDIFCAVEQGIDTVSYTHLTLPTMDHV